MLVHEKELPSLADAFALVQTVLAQLNLFITYGDTFLSDPAAYDDLYYELIRVSASFEDLYELAKRHLRSGSAAQPAAARLISQLGNIRAITNHFVPRIDAWLATHGVATPSTEQVLAIVREHYDTLTLKLQDNLDYFDKYSDNPSELPFLSSVTRLVVADNRVLSVSSFEPPAAAAAASPSP